ncbi:MAG: AmmeMemoRadiSam system protein A [Deltaproteobacteria bacterium]|nr:AmmeMemoRadiSam system protein A [Deltaproteobacteria bacterium]
MHRQSDTFGPSPTPCLQSEYHGAERRFLCELAHEAIVSRLTERALGPFTPSEHLSELRGVFTTLYLKGKLRGCVGYPLPLLPLYRAVVEAATGAAFEDPRFAPVTLAETRELRVSLSILSPVRPLRAEEVEIGRHGLLISQGGQRGLLLPQVAVEHRWDRLTFLEQTCRKAGLAPDAWCRGATIEGFSAEIFGDQDRAE